MGLTEEEEMAERIGIEERKLLLAQRKLESIRILDELLERVKVKCLCLLCVVFACQVMVRFSKPEVVWTYSSGRTSVLKSGDFSQRGNT